MENADLFLEVGKIGRNAGINMDINKCRYYCYQQCIDLISTCRKATQINKIL